MCKQLISPIIMACSDKIEAPAGKMSYEDCNDCGRVVKKEYLGQNRRRGPCDDCIENGAWVLVDNKWMKASDVPT